MYRRPSGLRSPQPRAQLKLSFAQTVFTAFSSQRRRARFIFIYFREHRTVQELKKEIAALTATVQKVSAQVEMSRPAPQTVVDNH